MPRKKPVPGSELEVLDGLRCMWELVAVYQFIGLFRSKFHFCWLAIEDLEASLVEDNSVVIADIVARLLRYSLQRTDIKIFNWEQDLHSFLKQHNKSSKAYPNSTPYGQLTPPNRLLLLKAVTDAVYDSNEEDLAEHLDDHHSPDDMRFSPIGQDSSSNLYWFFDDLRLYKEYRNPRKNRPGWECIASTYEEWHSFLKLLVKNTQPNESELYAYLHNEVMPFIQSPLESRREDRRLFKKRLRAATKIGNEEDVLQELKVPKYTLEELLEQESRDIAKMSEELAKLAKMANSADLKVNSHTHMSSPSLPSLLGKDEVPMLKEEGGLKMEGFKTELLNSSDVADIKREHFDDTMKTKDHKDGNMFMSDNSGKLTDDVKGQVIEEKGLPRGKRKGSVGDNKLKDTQWTPDLEDNKGNLKSNGENNKMPPDGMVPPGSHHMDFRQPPRYPPSSNSQEVYVFSTLLANRAAQAVYTGQADSIISFHRSQSAQREYLSPEQDTLPNSVPMQGDDNQRPPSHGPNNNPNHIQPHQASGNHNSNPRGQGSKDGEHNQPSPVPMQGGQQPTQRHAGNPTLPQQPPSQENNANEQSHNNPAPKGSGNSQPEGTGANPTEQATTNNPGSSKASAQSGSSVSQPVSNTVAQTKDTPPTTTTTKSKKKRKRGPSTSQPLQPNLPHPPNMPMSMGPHGPNFVGPFPPQHYGPGPGPGPGPGGFPQQHMQSLPMSMRPEVPPQFSTQPATETENLDPSALWENPPSNKKTAPAFPPGWQQEQQQIRMMQQQSPQMPMMSQAQSMMSHPSDPMMGPRPQFIDPAHGEPHPPEQFGQFGQGPGMHDPFDVPNYKPPQQIDNPTPEQLRRREEKIRTVKELQRLLFPEDHPNNSPTPTPNRMVSPTGSMGSMGVSSPREMPQPGMMSPQMNMMRPGMMGQQRPMMHPGMAGHPRMPQSEESMMVMTPEQRMMMSQQPLMMPPPPDWDNMTPPQREWYKLQQEFYQDKRRKMMDDQMKAAQMRMSEIPGPPNSFNDPMDMPMPGQGPMTPHGPMGHHGPMPLHGPGPGPGPGPSPGPGGPSPCPGPGPGPGPVPGPVPGPGPGQGPGPGPGPSPGTGPMSGPGMPPPPPYHSAHNPSMNVQRRSSVSGTYPSGPNQSFPMSPHHMPSNQQPSPRTSRSSSLPGIPSMPQQQQMQSTPGGSSLSMPPTPMSPAQQGSPIRPSYQPTTPTTAIATSMPSDANVVANNNVNRTAVATMEQSPTPGQPGTPVMDPNMQTMRMNKNNSQPGTPTATTTAKATPPVTCTVTATTVSTKSNCDVPVTTSVGTPKPQEGTANPQAKNSESSPGIPTQQRLVHFPSSQLNRDKAPNFPPRGEDLKQYASTFYQKTTKDAQKNQARLQHFGSPAASSPMSQEMAMSQGSQPSGMTSEPGMMTSQAGMMTSQSGMLTSQSGMMTSQSGMMTSQSAMMTSQSAMMTSQSRMMTSDSRSMTPDARTITSQSRTMSSPGGMLTPENRMMTPEQRMMISDSQMQSAAESRMMPESRMSSQSPMMPESRMMASEPRMMASEARMMASEPRMMMASEPRMMASEPRMMAPEPRMMAPEPRMMASEPRMMASEPRMMASEQRMLTSEPRMMGPQHRMLTSEGSMMSAQQAQMASQMRMQSRMPAQARMMMLQSRMSSPHSSMMSSPRMMSPEGGMHPSMMEGNPRMSPQQMMGAQQSGMMHQDGRMMSPDNRMMALESRMMTSQSGMMSSQNAMMSSQSRMMSSQSGMMPSPGMMTSPSEMTSPRMAGPGGMMSSESRMTSHASMIASQMMMSSQSSGMMSAQQARMSHSGMGDPGSRPHPMGHGHGMGGGTMQNMPFEQSHGSMPNQGLSGMHMGERLPSPQQKMAGGFHPNGGMQGMNMGQMPSSGMGGPMGSMPRTSTHQGMPGSMGPGGMVEGNPREHMMNQGQMPHHLDSKIPQGNPTPEQSPLSLLQSRFSPPLLPDGKGPKQTLQYFPAAGSTPTQQPGQGQSGNPHVNPGLPTNSAAQSGPKQIQMPFPMEMITGGGPNPGMNPSMGMGPQRMPPSGPRMNFPHEQFQGSYHTGPGSGGPRGGQMPSGFPSRQGMPPYNMPYGGNRMPNPGMGQPGMPGPGGYGDPMGFGGPPMQGNPMVMGEPMGPGYSMPK